MDSKKHLLLFIFFLFSCEIYAQNDTVYYFTKPYRVFANLKEARLAHPDSVTGLYLCCENLKTFPMEILKYKNLKYLSFNEAYLNWKIVYKHLSEKERQAYEQDKKLGKVSQEPYKPNSMFKIPKEITQLKKLEVIVFAYETNEANFQRIKELEALLPNTEIQPTSKELRADIDEPNLLYREE